MGRLHQVATRAKEITDRAVDRKKALNLPWRFEAARVPFALSYEPVRDFSAVVRILRRAVMDRGEGGLMGRSIAAQFISDQPIADVP